MSRFVIVLLAFASIVVHGFVPVVVHHRRLNLVRLYGRRKQDTREQSTSLSVVQESVVYNLSSFQSYTTDLSTRNTIVFDIDDTLCREYEPISNMKEHLACKDTYFFYPNWKILFDYLLANNCFNDIYSSGVDYINEPLMKDFMTDLYDTDGYEKLLHEGQFKVYSRHHKNDHEYKTLAPTLRVNQTLDNIILVDDYRTHCAPTEPESILVDRNFKHNIVSGLLGMFMTYFESKPQNETLRSFVGRVMPLNNYKILSIAAEQQYINKGLAEIRKIDPEALYYDETNIIDFICWWDERRRTK